MRTVRSAQCSIDNNLWCHRYTWNCWFCWCRRIAICWNQIPDLIKIVIVERRGWVQGFLTRLKMATLLLAAKKVQPKTAPAESATLERLFHCSRALVPLLTHRFQLFLPGIQDSSRNTSTNFTKCSSGLFRSAFLVAKQFQSKVLEGSHVVLQKIWASCLDAWSENIFLQFFCICVELE